MQSIANCMEAIHPQKALEKGLEIVAVKVRLIHIKTS